MKLRAAVNWLVTCQRRRPPPFSLIGPLVIRRVRLGLEEPGLVGEYDRLNAVAKAELLEDVGDVGLHRCLADVELLADLGVGEAAGNQAEDVELTLRQLVELSGRRRLWHAGEPLDHAFRDPRREERVAARDDSDRAEELLRRIVFEHESARADAERLVDVLVE